MSNDVRQFSVAEARRHIQHLFNHRQALYWADFLFFLILGYACAATYLNAPLFSWQQILCYFVAGFSLFRVGSFIHEIVHFRRGQMRAFDTAWNLLAGIPMLMPSFFYENHIDHHNTRHYGTGQDGEYLPLGNSSVVAVAKFFGQVLLLPIWVATRFLILTPISFLHPKLRQWTLERFSSFVINWSYRRQSIPENAPRRWWAFIEICCFFRVSAIFVCVGAGLVPPHRVILLYFIAVLTLGLNYVRNLVAHLYLGGGESMSHREQLLDSVNITGGWFTELFFPLGLRYHALHHLYPALPYHNLAQAHRTLMKELPEDSEYRLTVYPSYWSAVKTLLTNAARAAATNHRSARKWLVRRSRLIGN